MIDPISKEALQRLGVTFTQPVQPLSEDLITKLREELQEMSFSDIRKLTKDCCVSKDLLNNFRIRQQNIRKDTYDKIVKFKDKYKRDYVWYYGTKKPTE